MLTLMRRLEALLFIAPRPVSATEMAKACACEEQDVREALAALAVEFNGGRHGLDLREVGGGYTFSVAPDCEDDVRRLTGAERPDDLSPALLETLTVVAYLQPVTRADVAEVRGVSSEYALAALEQRGLVEQVGRADAAGAPLLYGTGERFLKLFGLRGLHELPALDEFALGAHEAEAIRARLLSNAEARRS